MKSFTSGLSPLKTSEGQALSYSALSCHLGHRDCSFQSLDSSIAPAFNPGSCQCAPWRSQVMAHVLGSPLRTWETQVQLLILVFTKSKPSHCGHLWNEPARWKSSPHPVFIIQIKNINKPYKFQHTYK